ncbi:protein bric-a-brac 1-like isoform X2 [Culicoides brevitarsis]|uniref:protein bric-a-brac 1-like isoform X2 n=1 Tax=Culicoides brevitarsis TaxID=469753 RepID=UPI00307C55CB
MRTKHIKRHHYHQSTSNSNKSASNATNIDKPKDLRRHRRLKSASPAPAAFSNSIIDLDNDDLMQDVDLNDISTDDENIPKNYSNKAGGGKRASSSTTTLTTPSGGADSLKASYTNFHSSISSSGHYFDTNNTFSQLGSDRSSRRDDIEDTKMGSSGGGGGSNSHNQYFSLRWNNYQSNMTTVFHKLLETQSFVDVTLACEGNYLKAHKVVLSACSGFFQRLLLDNPCKHPTIIMPSDIAFSDLQFIIDFVYRGEIDVSEAELQSLLKTAEHLKIKGLCEVSDIDNPLEYFYNPRQAHHHQQSSYNLSNTTRHAIPSSSGHHSKTFEKRLHSTPTKGRKSPRLLSPTKGDGQLISSDTETGTDKQEQRRTKGSKMASLGMGMNGGVMGGVPMGYLDFTPEPPAPSATPVTEHVDLNLGHSHDTRDLSNPAETMDIENHLSPHTITQQQSQQQQQQQQQQQHQSSSTPTHIMVDQQSRHSSHHSNSPQPQQQRQNSSPPGADDSSDQLDVKPNVHQLMQGEVYSSESEDTKLNDNSQSNMHYTNLSNTSDSVAVGNNGTNNGTSTPTGRKNSKKAKLDTSAADANTDDGSNGSTNGKNGEGSSGPKTWTPEDMDAALDALRNHNMSLTKASATYGIPSTTLWQRAHRLGIDTPKKEGPTKTWNEDSLNSALDALRTGQISANKASKAYGIPSSTLYKIARREGIRLAAPFNAAPTNWSAEDLERALEAIRAGQTSVQKASTEFGIPTGTLYGRCKREGIELSRSNPTPWSEDAMMEALEAVRIGHMSINQAAIHYNLPYSSLYGRFKRGRYDNGANDSHTDHSPDNTMQYTPPPQMQQQQIHTQYHHAPLQHQLASHHQLNTHHQTQHHHQVLPSSSQVVHHGMNNHHTIIYHETS